MQKKFQVSEVVHQKFCAPEVAAQKKFVNRKLHEKLSSTGSCTKKKFCKRKLQQKKISEPEVAP
jgi:hypothetical protein